MASHNIDMCAFLRQNPDFIKITQTAKISKEDTKDHIPKNMKFDIYPNHQLDGDSLMREIYSSSDSEEEEKEED
jgi:hypothetical protein